MDLARKRRRMATSMATRRVVEDIRWIVSLVALVADEDAAAAAERHVLEREGGGEGDVTVCFPLQQLGLLLPVRVPV